MMPRAHVIHQTHNRVRLRIREKRQHPGYFEAVRARLASVEGIDRVRVNSTTGSIVLSHPEAPFDEIAAGLRQPDLFEFVAGPEPAPSALAQLQSGVTKVNQVISEGTAGVADLKTVVVIVLVLVAIRQMKRGSFFGPALPLLWSALDLALRFKKDTQPPPEPEPAVES